MRLVQNQDTVKDIFSQIILSVQQYAWSWNLWLERKTQLEAILAH